MPRPGSELIDIACAVKMRKEKAIAVADGTTEVKDGVEREKWYWLPLSQVEENPDDGTVTMPTWLAQEKGLI